MMRNPFAAPRCFNRFLAICLCAVFALSLLLGAAYVFAERRHHCEGESCPVCEAVRQTVLYLAAQGAAVVRAPRTQAAARPAGTRRYSIPAAAVPRRSPVSLCVKLSD